MSSTKTEIEPFLVVAHDERMYLTIPGGYGLRYHDGKWFKTKLPKTCQLLGKVSMAQLCTRWGISGKELDAEVSKFMEVVVPKSKKGFAERTCSRKENEAPFLRRVYKVILETRTVGRQ